MDPLSDIISFLRLRSYLVGGFEAGGSWSVRFDAHDAVKCYTVANGSCWIAVQGVGEPVFLQSGDCFIQALRLYLNESKGIGWLFALSDKRVGAAIKAIHREPSRRWTVQTLATEAGMSRSGFAAQFRQLVGESPIEYLTKWRMLLAGRSLENGEPIGAIAHALGYESESAFRTAFKRVTGNSPRQHARSFGHG